MPDETTPCGSMRVTEWVGGDAYRRVWCPRTQGPCPYPGTEPDNDRQCTGGRVIKVGWSDESVVGAYEHLKKLDADIGNTVVDDYHEIGEDLGPAVSALRMCLPDGHPDVDR